MSTLPYNFNLRDWIQKTEDKLCCMGTYMDSPVMMSYNGTTGELTLTDQNGVETTVNLPLEQFLSQASYNNTTNVLTLTMSDNTTFDVDLSDLVDASVTPGGSNGEIQYNNAGAFAGSSQLIANIGTTNTLDIQGSGATSATNALRIRNSSGNEVFTARNDGAIILNNVNSGINLISTNNGNSPYINFITNGLASRGTIAFNFAGTTMDVGTTGGGYSLKLLSNNSTGILFGATGTASFPANTSASTPSMLLSGTGFSGGTSTTTKPTLLIEPTGTTSTGWSTSGTKLGVNAESGFTGNLLDLHINGSSLFKVDNSGTSYASGGGFYTSTGNLYLLNSAANASIIFSQGVIRSRGVADGVISLYNASATDFNRLQFGGTTSSFPSLKRSGTDLQVRLADDSGYAPIRSAENTIFGSDNSATTYAITATNLAGAGLFRVRNNGTGLEIGDWTGQGYGSSLRFTRPSGGLAGASFSQGNAHFTLDDGGYAFQIIGSTTASKPALHFTGTGFSGGTATTTKPTVLIEPTGTTSTGWSTSGTKLGVNAESGFTGRLLDLQVNGVSGFSVNPGGQVNASLNITSQSYILGTVIYGGSFRSTGAGANILFSSDGTFSMAQFGGTTSSFPALKRNGTGLDVRLADDSGFATLSAKALVLGGINDQANGIKLNRSVDGGTLLELTQGGSYGLVNICGFATNSGGLRLLGTASGLSYIDGWSEGTTKAQNYDIIIGSRVNNTTNSLTGNTTAETGSNVQIGFATATNPRAILSLNTTTRGFMPPRMTATERDAVAWASTDQGMVIFETVSKKLQCWDGATWNNLY